MQAKYRFINDSRFTVAIVKCFGVCPRAGKYAGTGYRGITLIAEVDNKPTEIQLVTPYIIMWADWAYSVLLQVRSMFQIVNRRENVVLHPVNIVLHPSNNVVLHPSEQCCTAPREQCCSAPCEQCCAAPREQC